MFQVNPWLIGIVAVCIGALSAFVITRIVSVHRQQPATGWEELIGKTALVKVTLAPEGTVLYKGENWTAVSEEGRIRAGETVVIKRVESLKLYVTKMPKEASE